MLPSHWSLLGTAVLVHFMAVASPGPNFLMITRNSLLYSRQAGLLTAVGVFSGSLIQMALGFIGVATLIESSPLLFKGLRLLGALYLLYLGGKALWRLRWPPSNSQQTPSDLELGASPKGRVMVPAHAFRIGLITMLTNPKAAIFFLAFFTTILGPGTPPAVEWAMIGIMPAVTLGWHATVALAFSQPRLRQRYLRYDHWLQFFFGVLLVAWGASILYSLF